MTPADKRIAELLDRWLASIELHLKYAALDDVGYRQVQPWPEHDRPTRWILEVAQQKVLQLRSLSHLHSVQQDGSFAEGLELMCFLANLVGAHNIKRFIPLADPAREQMPNASPGSTLTSDPATESVTPIPPVQAPVVNATQAPQDPGPFVAQDIVDETATREIPVAKAIAAAASPIDSTREMPRLRLPAKEPEPVQSNATAKRAHGRQHATSKPASVPASSARVQETVIADAVRLLKWGREWHELADLIARMAERPSASEVRRILKTQRRTIESQLTT